MINWQLITCIWRINPSKCPTIAARYWFDVRPHITFSVEVLYRIPTVTLIGSVALFCLPPCAETNHQSPGSNSPSLPLSSDAKPVPIKVGPAAAAAAAAAAARHEVQVTQLEDQLAGHQRDLAAARGDLQHASRCFDAAMVMVNYLSNEVRRMVVVMDEWLDRPSGALWSTDARPENVSVPVVLCGVVVRGRSLL